MAKVAARAAVAGLPTLDEPVPDLSIDPELDRGKVGRPRIWDPVKVVDYVCSKMAEGKIITHILNHIGMDFVLFLSYVDSTAELSKKYAQARKAEARAVAALARDAANGVDPISAGFRKRMEEILTEALKTAGAAEGVAQMVIAMRAREHIEELERNMIARNRLQVDTLKWYAKITDPETFGERSTVGIETPNGDPLSVRVEFVEPKKSEPDAA